MANIPSISRNVNKKYSNKTQSSTLKCENRWTHANFLAFHAIQILVKKLI